MKRLLFCFLVVSTSVFSQSNNDAVLDEIFKGKTEVYFKFNVPSKMAVNELSKVVSIDHKSSANVIHAYANRNEFSAFLSYGLPYTLLKSAGELAKDPIMLKAGKKKKPK